MLKLDERSYQLDRIRNDRIRGIAKLGEISKKVLESSLKWSGHIFRREEECVGKSVMVIKVPGREGDEVRSESGWITSGTTCRRENCQGI